MQDNAQNKQSNVLYSNVVSAEKQFEYLGKLGENELNSEVDYSREKLMSNRASQIDKDLSRHTKSQKVMILGKNAPQYNLNKDNATEAILKYKPELISFLKEQNVPEDQYDQLASMMINLNNQGLYAGLHHITAPLLQGYPFVPINSPSYNVSLRKTDKNEYLVDTQYYIDIAHVDNSKEKLTQLNINYTFDLEKKTMQFKVEDTENLASTNPEFNEVFKLICQDLIDKYDKKNIFASQEFNNEHQKAARVLEDLFQDNHFRGIDRTITTLDNNIARKFRGINFKYMHPEIYYELSEQAQHGIDELGRRLENQSIFSWIKRCCSTPNRDDMEILGNLLNS